MSKKSDATFPDVADVTSPLAFNDFHKSNGYPSSKWSSDPGGPSLTRQEFAEECDVNSIMARYDGFLSDPMRSVREPVYYDFTQSPDTLMGAMEVFHRASEAFF